ncbi:hypothetical protein pEaSNUABM37_00208 [Erwinia phage pEa_SNUABM_37]|nr:hypothetical protein pEaSNUABM37_00208 [Erwinia phage pEa_SNUABM_37]QXO10678.1 hypothetical protein pEaSNUABM48_00208 [Erwinia phage pEa_SNUABM_48]
MLETLLVVPQTVKAVNTVALMRAADGFVDLAGKKTVNRYFTTAINAVTTKFNNASFDFTGGFAGIGAATDFVWTKDQTFTIEWWQYCIQFNSNNWFLADGTGTSSCLKTFNDNLYLQTEGGGGALIATTSAMAINVWQHVALVQTGGMLKVYVNGVQKLSITAVGNFGLASTILTIGGGNGNYTARAYMDQFRVSNIARYVSTFTPPTKAFTID